MTTIRATFRVATPLFSRGADGKTAELREPSFKGVLRFWWRACAWPRFAGRLDDIREQEERVFGGSSLGQSRVAIQFVGSRPKSEKRELTDVPSGRDGGGARYLGYGLMHADGSKNAPKTVLDRGRLIAPGGAPPLDVMVELRLRGLADEQRDLLVNALRALGTCGGMGARSRRGYGSLALISLDGDMEPEQVTTLDGLQARVATLQELGGRGPDALPEYTALSPHSRFLILKASRPDGMGVLGTLGAEYQEFRQAKKDDMPPTLKRDARIVLSGQPSDQAPRRVAFGLPINYGQGKPVVKPDGHERRASPLFFHIHACEERAFAVASFLPARFLPEKANDITIGKGAGQRRVPLPETEELYRPVHEFLDYLAREGSPFEAIGVGRR